MSGQVLLNEITATAATKVPFYLTMKDFAGNSLPALKASGLGTGDSILIWEWINGAWSDSGATLTSAAEDHSKPILTPGRYAVTAVLLTAGPVSCELNSATRS